MSRLLLASIHDVGPRFAPQVDALAERLDRHLGAARFAMLVVPDHWDAAPLAADALYARRLRAWADAGVEMFVHGWSHRDPAPAGFARRHMTAGEGEFAALGRAEARARMVRARAVVEDATGARRRRLRRPGMAVQRRRARRAGRRRLRARRGSFPRLAAGRRRGAGARPGRHLGVAQPVAAAVVARRRRRGAPLPGRPAHGPRRRPPRRHRPARDPVQHRRDARRAGAGPAGGALRRARRGGRVAARGRRCHVAVTMTFHGAGREGARGRDKDGRCTTCDFGQRARTG